MGKKNPNLDLLRPAVPVPISVIPVPKGYCLFCVGGTGTSKSGTGTTVFFFFGLKKIRLNK